MRSSWRGAQWLFRTSTSVKIADQPVEVVTKVLPRQGKCCTRARLIRQVGARARPAALAARFARWSRNPPAGRARWAGPHHVTPATAVFGVPFNAPFPWPSLSLVLSRILALPVARKRRLRGYRPP